MLTVTAPAEPVRVAVLRPDGTAVGGGILLTSTYVATCAHVVAAACGDDPADARAPAGPVTVGLSGRSGADGSDAARRPARVVRWHAVQPDGTGDIAVLALDRPVAVPAPRLHRLDEPWGRRFRATSAVDGTGPPATVTGELRAGQGTGWIQLRTDSGSPISAGFSGSPVWDDDLGSVVGMTVAADFNPARMTAYMIPIRDVCRLEPAAIRNPYRGLAPFREADAELFYGRDAEIDRLADVLDRERFAVAVGPSGVGKSSLVRAGLLPRLRAAGIQVVDLASHGAGVEALVAAVDAPSRPDDDVVIVADQFEELLTTAPGPAVRALLDRLVDAADDPGRRTRVVMTLRWTDLGELVTASTAARIDTSAVPLAPLAPARLRDAITGPTAWAPGLDLEDGLVDRICADTGPGQLPLVEAVLRRLAGGHDGGVMTHDAYTGLGGVDGGVRRLADDAIAEIDAWPDAERSQVRAQTRTLLTGLATVDETGFVRRRRRWAELSPAQRRIAEVFVRRRLLVLADATPAVDNPRAPSETVSDGASVEFAHQAVIDHWPALREWLAEDAAYLRWLADTTRRRDAWLDAGRDPGALLRGSSLAVAREWVTDRSDTDSGVREYVTASAGLARRESRRRTVLTAVVAIATAAAVVLGSLFAYHRSIAEAHEAVAGSRQLAAMSSAIAAADPSFSVLLALAAYRHHPTDQARQTLFDHYLEYRGVKAVLSGGLGRINAVDTSADGRLVAASTGSGLVTVWDRADPGGVTPARLPAEGNVTAFRVTADGTIIQAMETFAPDDHVVFGHHLASGERAWEVRFDTSVDTLTFGDDRFAVILAGSPDGPRTQQVWTVAGPRPRLVGERQAPGPLQEVHGFGPDQGTVVLRSLSDSGGLDLDRWDAAIGSSARIAEGVHPAGRGYWLDEHDRVSPTGTTVLCDDRAGELQVISVLDGTAIGDAPLPADERCADIVIDDRAVLAVGDATAVDLVSGQAVPLQGLRPYLPDETALAYREPWQRSRRLADDGDRTLTILHDSQRIVVTELHPEPRADGPEGPRRDADLLAGLDAGSVTSPVIGDGLVTWYEAGSEVPVSTLHLGVDRAGEARRAVAVSSAGGLTVRVGDVETVVSLHPEDWIESVCAVIGRAAFTDAEATTLPEWATAEPLC